MRNRTAGKTTTAWLLSQLLPDTITHRVHPVSEYGKRGLLTKLLRSGEIRQCIVFMRTKQGCSRLTRELQRAGIKADAIHGDKPQASRLRAPEPLLRTEWIKPGAFVVPYGTMSAVELSLTDIMAKLVVDDCGQCKGGQFGSLRAHVEAGKLSAQTLHAEMGEIVAGRKAGRESEDESILFWHRGLSLSDIALGFAMLEKARLLGIGQTLRFH